MIVNNTPYAVDEAVLTDAEGREVYVAVVKASFHWCIDGTLEPATLRPAHVDARWLAEASRSAPVPALFAIARPSGRYVLFGVVPGDAHADVKVDVVIRGRDVRVEAESINLAARNAHVRLDTDGNVSVRGRDLTSHARRVNRIKGGAIRLN